MPWGVLSSYLTISCCWGMPRPPSTFLPQNKKDEGLIAPSSTSEMKKGLLSKQKTLILVFCQMNHLARDERYYLLMNFLPFLITRPLALLATF